MLMYLKEEANKTLTENGAVTYCSSGSELLDLFASIGALRNASEEEICCRFRRAFAENADYAMKLLFFARDIREGLGERRVFRVILNDLAHTHADAVRKNIPFIAEYGRYDDLLSLLDTPCEGDVFALIRRQLRRDKAAMKRGESVSLLAKWLPSINASSERSIGQAMRIASALGYDESYYRRTLSALRAHIDILENHLRSKDYSFSYEHQPSKAMLKYRRAFLRHDRERYLSYLDKVQRGEAVLHTDTLTPYDLVARAIEQCDVISEEEKRILNATWDALPSYDNDENVLPIIDCSGSMYCSAKTSPAAIAFSLGLYMAEHTKGMFHNHFVEFSAVPELIEIKGENFFDRLRYVMSFGQCGNTDLEAVFELLLRTAVKNRLPQSELPSKLIIVSDMEFDSCMENAELSNFENAKRKFADHGYRLPDIVFWFADSRSRQQPVTMHESGTMLVSGVSPQLFSMVAGHQLSPYSFMMEVLRSERYAPIVA